MDDITKELINEDEKIPLLKKVSPDTIIADGLIKIIASKEKHDFDGNIIETPEMFVYLTELDWHWDDTGEYYYLTLDEIKKQLLELRYAPPFYVWYEQALNGIMYEYENTKCNIWLKHGETKGYA